IAGRIAHQALSTAAERGDRAFAHLAGVERGDDRQTAAALLAAATTRGPRRRRGPRRAGGAAAPRAPSLVILGFRLGIAQVDLRRTVPSAHRRSPRGCRLGRLALFLAEALLGLLLGLALCLVVVAAAILFVLLARLGFLALGPLDGVALVAPARFF